MRGMEEVRVWSRLLEQEVMLPALGDRDYSYGTAFVSRGNRPLVIGDWMTDSSIVLTDQVGVAY